MAKKVLPKCVKCDSNEALYVTLSNGKKLPSYVMRIGAGIWCNPCDKADKAQRVSA